MSFLTVFIPSLILTVIIGTFLPLAWRGGVNRIAIAAYWAFALLVHIAWLELPQLGAVAPYARCLAILWIASMLAALVLLIPFALLTAISMRFKLKSVLARLPMAYASCFIIAGIILTLTSTAGFVVREEDIRIPGLAAGLDGFRIANLGDVHIGRFIDAKELGRGIAAINAQRVDLLVITGDHGGWCESSSKAQCRYWNKVIHPTKSSQFSGITKKWVICRRLCRFTADTRRELPCWLTRQWTLLTTAPPCTSSVSITR